MPNGKTNFIFISDHLLWLYMLKEPIVIVQLEKSELDMAFCCLWDWTVIDCCLASCRLVVDDGAVVLEEGSSCRQLELPRLLELEDGWSTAAVIAGRLIVDGSAGHCVPWRADVKHSPIWRLTSSVVSRQYDITLATFLWPDSLVTVIGSYPLSISVLIHAARRQWFVYFWDRFAFSERRLIMFCNFFTPSGAGKYHDPDPVTLPFGFTLWYNASHPGCNFLR